jgi:hypothetical protein
MPLAHVSPQKQVLWYLPQEELDVKTRAGFAEELFNDLGPGLSEIGYMLRNYSPHDSLVRSATSPNDLCMFIHITDNVAIRESGGVALVVELCKIGELTRANHDSSVFRQLVLLAYTRDDPTTLRSVFVKKIVENLRSQYICNVSITSDPEGVRVKTPTRLTDVTPLEWVVPAGSLRVQCVKNNYLAFNKDLPLPKPGSYAFYFQMKKRQFYNSNFFYPALALFLGSAVCYYGKGYFYDRYNRLGEIDLRNSPGSFQSTFQTAKDFEYGSIAFLATGCCLLGLTFWF